MHTFDIFDLCLPLDVCSFLVLSFSHSADSAPLHPTPPHSTPLHSLTSIHTNIRPSAGSRNRTSPRIRLAMERCCSRRSRLPPCTERGRSWGTC